MQNPFDPGYYISAELRQMGFARVGEDSAVSRNCTIIGVENITIGDHVRVDGFTSIIAPAGKVRIGSHVQIGIGCVLGARGGIELGDYSSLSHGVRILSAVDDFDGRWMTNSTLPKEVLHVQAAPVRVGRFVPVGSGTLILPGVEIGEGAAIGAMSLVRQSVEGWKIYSGNPLHEVGERSRDLLQKAEHLAAREGQA